MAGVVIVGSTGSFGSEFARIAAEDKKDIILVGRNREALEEQARLLRQFKIKVEIIVCDLMDNNAVERIMREVQGSEIKPDQLIYAAGAADNARFDEISDESIRRINTINITVPQILTKRFADYIEENGMQRDGRIMITTGTAGLSHREPNPVYGASRAALLNAFPSMWYNLYRRGISLTNFMPGLSRNRAAIDEFGVDILSPNLANPQEICQRAYLAMQKAESYYIGAGTRHERRIWNRRYISLIGTTDDLIRIGRHTDHILERRENLKRRRGEPSKEEVEEILRNPDNQTVRGIRMKHFWDNIRKIFSDWPRLDQSSSSSQGPNQDLPDNPWHDSSVEPASEVETSQSQAQVSVEHEAKRISTEKVFEYLVRIYGLNTPEAKQERFSGQQLLEQHLPRDVRKKYELQRAYYAGATDKIYEIESQIVNKQYPRLQQLGEERLIQLVHLTKVVGIPLNESNTESMLIFLNKLITFESGKQTNSLGLRRDQVELLLLLCGYCAFSGDNRKSDSSISNATEKVLKIAEEMKNNRYFLNNKDFLELLRRYPWLYVNDQLDSEIHTTSGITQSSYDWLRQFSKEKMERFIIEEEPQHQQQNNGHNGPKGGHQSDYPDH